MRRALTAWVWGSAAAAALSGTACGGCGGDDRVCGAGTIEVDGECVPSGPDGGAGGTACGAGTRPDGDGGCVASDRPSDQRSCLGRFGPIGEDAADTVFVDGAYAGGGSDGTAAAPYTTIQAGVDAASDGDTVAIASGTYDEDVTVSAPRAIEGRCAREVTIDGSVAIAAAGSSLRGVTVTNGGPGVAVQNAPGDVEPFGVVIGTSVIEMNGFAGIQIDASDVEIAFSEVRLTQPGDPDDVAQLGSGVYVFGASNVTVRDSVIEMNGAHGIDFADATGSLSAAVEGDRFLVSTARSSGVIEMNVIEMNGLMGVRAGAVPLGGLVPFDGPQVQVLSNEINDNGEHGIALADVRADVSDNTLSNNGSALDVDAYAVAVSDGRVSIVGNRLSGSYGAGIHTAYCQGVVAGNDVSAFPNGGIAVVESNGGASVSNNAVTGVGNVGIHVLGGDDILVDGNEITGTLLGMGAGRLTTGHGVFISRFPSSVASYVDVRNNLVAGSAGTGITLSGITPLDGSEPLYLVTDNEVARNGSAGINVQSSGDGDVVGNDIHDNARYGIRGLSTAVGSARLRIFSNSVETTATTAAGNDGDGIALVASHVGVGQALAGNSVQGAERAGILITGLSSGFCNDNRIGETVENGEYDLLIEGAATTGMAETGNTTGTWGVDISVSEIEPVDITPATIQTMSMPIDAG